MIFVFHNIEYHPKLPSPSNAISMFNPLKSDMTEDYEVSIT